MIEAGDSRHQLEKGPLPNHLFPSPLPPALHACRYKNLRSLRTLQLARLGCPQVTPARSAPDERTCSVPTPPTPRTREEGFPGRHHLAPDTSALHFSPLPVPWAAFNTTGYPFLPTNSLCLQFATRGVGDLSVPSWSRGKLPCGL